MFLYYEDFAEENMKIHIVRVHIDGEQLDFEESIVSIS
jgi:hypothetical protein